jgi:HK97 family phage major capsid protein
VSDVLQDLQAKRREARSAADSLITRAADDGRDLSPEELSSWQEHVATEREINERVEELHESEVREMRASLHRSETEQHANHENVLGEWLVRAITGASGAGAAFTPTEFPAVFFDKLSAQSVLLRTGVRVITTDRDSVTVPRWTTDTESGWYAEGNAITSTSGVADTVTATPRKLAALETINNEVLADSNPSIFEVIASGLVRSISLKADLGFFRGSGSAPEIRGLVNVTGGQIVNNTVGALTNLDPVADMIGALEAENASPGAFVCHPTLWKLFMKLKEATSANNKPLLQDSAGSGAQGVTRSVYGVPVYLSSQLTTSGAFMYDPTEVVVVRRSDVSVELDRSRLFNSDQSEIRALARIDMIVPNPKSIALIGGVTG